MRAKHSHCGVAGLFLRMSILSLWPLALAGCEKDSPAENAAEAIDDAVDEVEDAAEDVADEVEDAVDDNS